MGIGDRQVRKGFEVYENGDDAYIYKPGELLVDSAHDAFTERVLDGAIRDKRAMHERLDVSHYDVDGDLHGIVERLRKEGVRCGPNHILAGEPRYKGGPGTIVEPTELGFSTPEGDHGSGVTIAVLDTGYTAEVAQWLDPQVDMGGEGDEATIAAAITEACTLDADIINLSLGAYTHGNLPPVGLANALRQVPRTSVVVAAAGNAGRDVPFWPAALKQVWSVAAVDGDDQRACFSNFGHWVDCAARGVDIKSCFPTWT